MKISKALRVKNQLVLKIIKIQHTITKYNSYNTLNKPKWDVGEKYKELCILKEKLIDLKTKISLANRPILQTIHSMEEAKAFISFIKEIPVEEGMVNSNYSDRQDKFACSINEILKNKLIEDLQDELESFQDTLAEHNAKTEIVFKL